MIAHDKTKINIQDVHMLIWAHHRNSHETSYMFQLGSSHYILEKRNALTCHGALQPKPQDFKTAKTRIPWLKEASQSPEHFHLPFQNDRLVQHHHQHWRLSQFPSVIKSLMFNKNSINWRGKLEIIMYFNKDQLNLLVLLPLLIYIFQVSCLYEQNNL
jgi:hypothetical protein